MTSDAVVFAVSDFDVSVCVEEVVESGKASFEKSIDAGTAFIAFRAAFWVCMHLVCDKLLLAGALVLFLRMDHLKGNCNRPIDAACRYTKCLHPIPQPNPSFQHCNLGRVRVIFS